MLHGYDKRDCEVTKMLINELEAQLAQEGLFMAHVGMSIKKYVRGDLVYKDSQWDNCVDVYGIFKGEDGRYCIFITDSERGIPQYRRVFSTESEACQALKRKISLEERIYQEKMMGK